MAELDTHISFNERRGYVIEPDGLSAEGGAPMSLRPPHTFMLPADTSVAELGAALARAHKSSLANQAMPVGSGFRFRELVRFAGCRSERQFLREYRRLVVSYSEAEVVVLSCHTEPNGYAPWPTKETDPYISLSACPRDEEVGAAALSLLGRAAPAASATRRVETLGGAAVEYDEPADCLEFLGDGHTDAYEVWGAPQGPGFGSRAAIMVDSGYDREGSGFDAVCAEAVRAAWGRWYGGLASFSHSEGPDGRIASASAACTDGTVVEARFLPGGGGRPVEALAVVEPDAPIDVREALLSVVRSARVAP